MMKSPAEIVNLMLTNDPFSQWLNINVETLSKGKCSLSIKISDEMLNGFNIAHGGIGYSLADSCLAFASNSNGCKAVTIDTSFSYLKKVSLGDTLIAYSNEEFLNSKIGVYLITILNQNNEKIAFMKGTVSISNSEW
jgi:acyl-CoA thioesterase